MYQILRCEVLNLPSKISIVSKQLLVRNGCWYLHRVGIRRGRLGRGRMVRTLGKSVGNERCLQYYTHTHTTPPPSVRGDTLSCIAIQNVYRTNRLAVVTGVWYHTAVANSVFGGCVMIIQMASTLVTAVYHEKLYLGPSVWRWHPSPETIRSQLAFADRVRRRVSPPYRNNTHIHLLYPLNVLIMISVRDDWWLIIWTH